MSQRIGYSINKVLTIIYGVIVFFISLRIIFQFFNANAATPFVAWVNKVSDTIIYPFRGIFPNIQFGNGFELDIVALTSLIAYALLIYFIQNIVSTLARPRSTITYSHI